MARTDRGLPAPAAGGAGGGGGASLSRDAIILTGGVVIYALLDSGVLADSGYVLPGAVRVGRSDLRAIAPKVAPGVTVYCHE